MFGHWQSKLTSSLRNYTHRSGFSMMQIMNRIQSYISQNNLHFTAVKIITNNRSLSFTNAVCCGSGAFQGSCIPRCFSLWYFHIKMCSQNHLTSKGLVNPFLKVKYFHWKVVHVALIHIPLAKMRTKIIPNFRGVERALLFCGWKWKIVC